MTSKVHQSLGEITQAMQGFNAAMESWIEELRNSGENPEQITRLRGGAKAMQNSGNIYLAWAEHLANGMPQEDDIDLSTLGEAGEK